MPVTLDQVKELIQTEFPGADVSEIIVANDRIEGPFKWEHFKGKGFRERNSALTSKVRRKLGLNGSNVGTLFPLAPGETLGVRG